LERALATAEATLTLLREQLSLQEERRLSERKEFASWVEGIRTQIYREAEEVRNWVASCTNNQGAAAERRFANLGEKLDQLHELAGIPARDIPTVEELLDQARTDDSKRKLLQTTLAELEFENTEVDFN
jgi:hypothetical protein